MKEAAFCNRLLAGNGEVLAESREMDCLTKEEQKRAGEALLEQMMRAAGYGGSAEEKTEQKREEKAENPQQNH